MDPPEVWRWILHMCRPSPLLDQAAGIEDPRDERVAGPRLVRALEVFGPLVDGERAVAPDLEAVVVDGRIHSPACDGVVPVAEGVHKGHAQGCHGEELLVDALDSAAFEPSSDGEVAEPEVHPLFEEVEDVPMHLGCPGIRTCPFP